VDKGHRECRHDRRSSRSTTGTRSRSWRARWGSAHLTLVYRDEPLAQYRVTYQLDQRRLKAVTPEQLFETPHRSPPPPPRTWGDGARLPVLRLPAYAPRRTRPTGATQPPLFPLDEGGT
jgi:hypothetical protein